MIRVTSILGSAAVAMALVLAGCNGEPAKPASTFKPVPVSPVIGDVVMGDPAAKVEMVEYAALTCHVCRDFAKQVFPRIKATYIDTGKIKYIYRDFPLEAGPDGKATDGFGVLLASVARCKGAEQFYDTVDAIFGTQGDLLDGAREGNALPVLAKVAAARNISVDEMQTCIDHQPELRASIKASRDKASTELKITGTPSIFVNGQLVEDKSFENLSKVIDAALSGNPAPVDPAAPPAAPAAPAAPAQ